MAHLNEIEELEKCIEFVKNEIVFWDGMLNKFLEFAFKNQSKLSVFMQIKTIQSKQCAESFLKVLNTQLANQKKEVTYG